MNEMKTFYTILCLFLTSGYQAHVITDNSVKIVKCERYEDPSDPSTIESDSNIYSVDYDPDTEICSSDAVGKPYCFTLWSNDSKGVEIRRQGCFQSTDDCSGQTSCVSHGKQRSLHFCCCEGDLCNREFSYEPIFVPHDEREIRMYNAPTIFQFLGLVFFICAVTGISMCYIVKRGIPCIKDKHHHVQVALNPEESSLHAIELLEVKAHGRFGTVWKAKCRNDLVAVKILPTEYYQLWSNELNVFRLPKMDHENIVQFIGGEDRINNGAKQYWIVTAYQELGSLHDYLKYNTVTWEQLCIISFTMARGLAHLHEEIPCEKSDVFKPSIAHRDFKSANVLLKRDLTACIADFGFAYAFHSAVCDSHHARIGTKRYMAPEVLEGVVGFSNNSFLCMDMYACALVLWEILSRCSVHEDVRSKYQLPYAAELGENVSIEALQEFVVSKKGRPVLKDAWKLNPLLSNVCEIIEDCWDHDAEARLSAACITDRFSWHLRSAVSCDTKLIV